MKLFHFILRVLLIFLASSIWVTNLQAQFSESIGSDRPGQAISPLTVGTGVFQVQTGFTLGGFNTNVANGVDFSGDNFQYVLNPRVGITERFEINSQIAARRDEIGNLEFSGLSQVNLGARYNIVFGEGLAPSIAIQFDVSLPWVSDDYDIDSAVPRVLLAHSQNLTEALALTTNFGLVFNTNADNITSIYIVNLSFPIADKVGAFVEGFANSTDGDFDINFDAGISYLVNNDLQLDVSGGYGSNDNVNDWFIDAGVSWRFKYN